MKFRLFVLLALFACSTWVGKAQAYVGGSFAILNNFNYGGTFVQIAPEIGVSLTDKFGIGGSLGYYSIEGTGALFFAPYARVTFVKKGLLSLFADGGVDLFLDDEVSFGVGITPGILVDTNTKFSFFAKYGYLGYSNTPINISSGINLSSNNLNIGFYYNF
jgi:hypothetical protein